jgi:TPR repeat protein
MMLFEAGITGDPDDGPRDDARAIELLTELIEKGSADAMYCLGPFYVDDRHQPVNVDEGLALIRQAAEAGHQEARKYLAKWDKKAKK